MKKLFLVMVMVSLAVFMSGYAEAISGPCVDCHTMHNSQDGSPMAELFDGSPDATANEVLLRFECIACHTTTSGATNATSGAPAVLHTVDPTDQGAGFTNAGGSFYWVDQAGDDTMGHNVVDLPTVNPDDNLGFDPPGWDNAHPANVNGGGATWAAQLTCGGTVGCHGSHAASTSSFGAISGSHHPNITGWLSVADQTYNSYRFLDGILGYEDDDYEWTAAANDHNDYWGADDTAGRNNDGTYNNSDTISYLCSQCHGFFHEDIDAAPLGGSPWIRHPTDLALPGAGTEYAGYTTYNPIVPIGRTVAASMTGAVTTVDTNDTVVCVSCHRAHGSNQPDLLRWDYAGMDAGTTGASAGTGCFVCHTTKDGI